MKRIIFFISLLSFILLSVPFPCSAASIPKISAKSACLYDIDAESFIISKEMNMRLPMASTTKIMTALLAIEQCNLDEVISVPREAVGVEGSSVYLREDDLISVKNLVYSVLLQSANDAAEALAIYISGDVHSFADLMNKRAAEIGLSDTSFENPHGLDSENHYTTAHDLAILTSVAVKNDVFLQISSTFKYEFDLSESKRLLVNHNKLLRTYPDAYGVKTGYTKKSGRCLVSYASREGKNLICVTLDAPNDWSDHKNMLDYGFSASRLTSTNSSKFIADMANEEKLQWKKSDCKNLYQTQDLCQDVPQRKK